MKKLVLIFLLVLGSVGAASAQDLNAVLQSTRAASQQKNNTGAVLGGVANAMRQEEMEQQADLINVTDGVAAAMKAELANTSGNVNNSSQAQPADFYSSDIHYSTYGTDSRADIASPASSKYVNPYIMGTYSPTSTFAAPGGKEYISRSFGPAQQVPVAGAMTSGFGYRPSFGRMHHGVDLSLHVGDTVRAAFPGKVVLVANDPDGYGRYVKVKHDNGLETLYGHLSAPLVKFGQQLAAGQPLGLGGTTGNATGPHLHFETRLNGVAVDPTNYFNFGSGKNYGRKSPTTPLNDNGTKKTATATKSTSQPAQQQKKPKIKSETVATAAGSGQKANTGTRSGTYQVRRGDTVDKIARDHGMSVAELCRINKMSKYTPMYPGKVIRLK